MHVTLPEIHLVRHGETAWTATRQHTGLTDIPLTATGERDAYRLGRQLQRRNFPHVLTSPLVRARRTCELAGFGSRAEVDPDLVEWDYGEYEGRTTADIRAKHPGWQLFRDGCPGGESVPAIAARADRVVARLRSLDGDVVLFSSGHFLRVLAARWLGLDAALGRCFLLGTTTLSILGYEHGKDEPVLRLWNDVRPGNEREE